MNNAVTGMNDNISKQASNLSESTTSNFSQASQEEEENAEINGMDAHSAMAAAKMKYDEIVLKKIKTVKEHSLNKLDLSRLGISEIPHELLDLEHLQYLYLEGNALEALPESFFDRLPNLKWLDLRRNYLSSIPHTYIGQHKNLQTLLLEGNELKSLPLELGWVETLRGLNICDNPLEFPPSQVIEQGTRAVLNFMRDLLQAKCSGTIDLSAQSSDFQSTTDLSDSMLSKPDSGDNFKSKHRRGSLASSSDLESYYDEMNSNLTGLVLHSASLHRLPNEKRKSHKSQVSGKPSSADKAEIMLRRKKKSSEINKYPEPPPPDRVEQRFMEERKLSKLRHIKMKQEDVLQKRRETEFLKSWRSDAKKRQADKYREAAMYGGAKDPVDVADQAPFGVDKGFMKVPTNEERIKMAVQKKHEEIRRPISPETRMRMERERQARDQELERKLRGHIKKMLERRKQPRDDPAQGSKAMAATCKIGHTKLHKRPHKNGHNKTATLKRPQYLNFKKRNKYYHLKV